MLPQLRNLSSEFSVWWTFKSDSKLKLYLEQENYLLNKYFTPQELYNIIDRIANTYSLFDYGNSSLIILNETLRNVFDTDIIFRPNIKRFCLSHVENVPYKKNLKLKNQYIAQHFKNNFSTDNLLYSDPSSVFWLHPVVNNLLSKNHTFTYSWNNLVEQFMILCSTNTDHFTQLDCSIIEIKSTSPISEYFKTNYFHISQCESILKSLTKFLGRTNSIHAVCKQINFNINKNEPVFDFIDNLINTSHTLSPTIDSYIYI